jgi:hypothetical protein
MKDSNPWIEAGRGPKASAAIAALMLAAASSPVPWSGKRQRGRAVYMTLRERISACAEAGKGINLNAYEVSQVAAILEKVKEEE